MDMMLFSHKLTEIERTLDLLMLTSAWELRSPTEHTDTTCSLPASSTKTLPPPQNCVEMTLYVHRMLEFMLLPTFPRTWKQWLPLVSPRTAELYMDPTIHSENYGNHAMSTFATEESLDLNTMDMLLLCSSPILLGAGVLVMLPKAFLLLAQPTPDNVKHHHQATLHICIRSLLVLSLLISLLE